MTHPSGHRNWSKEGHVPRGGVLRLSLAYLTWGLWKKKGLSVSGTRSSYKNTGSWTCILYLVWVGFLSLALTRILPKADISSQKWGLGSDTLPCGVVWEQVGWQAVDMAFCYVGGWHSLVSGNKAAGQIFPFCVLERSPVHFHVSAEPIVTKLKWVDCLSLSLVQSWKLQPKLARWRQKGAGPHSLPKEIISSSSIPYEGTKTHFSTSKGDTTGTQEELNNWGNLTSQVFIKHFWLCAPHLKKTAISPF